MSGVGVCLPITLSCRSFSCSQGFPSVLARRRRLLLALTLANEATSLGKLLRYVSPVTFSTPATAYSALECYQSSAQNL